VRFLIQVNCDVSVDSKHQTVSGVAFPLSEASIGELKRLKAGKVNYVQLVMYTDCLEILSMYHSDLLCWPK